MKNLMFFLIFGILLVSSLSLVLADNNNGNNNQNNECTTEQDCINIGKCSVGLECTCSNNKCYPGLVREEAEDDDNESEDNNDECEVDADCDEDEKCINDECEDNDEDDGKNKTTFLPWQKRNESECPEGCKCRGAVVSCRTETGKTLTIEAGRSGNIITITIVKGEDDDEEPEDEEEDVEANTTLEVEQESRLITGGTKLKVKLSNGNKADIKVMPDVASETALERLRLKVCSSENNCSIELKEVPVKNQKKAAYEIQVERHFKILSLFEAKARVKAQVDAETGEIIIVKKPWWAFLAIEPEE